MSKARQLLNTIHNVSESSNDFDGRKGETIQYYDENGDLKSGVLSEDIRKGEDSAKLTNGVKLTYDQFESWWMPQGGGTFNREKMNNFTDLVYSKHNKDKRRMKHLSPFELRRYKYNW